MDTYNAKSKLRDVVRHGGNFEKALLNTRVDVSVVVGTIGKNRSKYLGAYFFSEDAQRKACETDFVVTMPVNDFTQGIYFPLINAELRNNFI